MKKILNNIFNKHYKKLLIVPIILFILSLTIISVYYSKTGEIVNKDVSLKGGITASVYTENIINLNELEKTLKSEFKHSDIFVRKIAEFGTNKQIGVVVEASEITVDQLKSSLENNLNLKLTEKNYSVEEMGSSLGESFYRQMIIAIVLAFVFMAIVVLIAFRSLIPSVAVVLSAILNMLVIVAVVNLFDIRVGTAGIAAILLIIGYSIDTDILLTTRVLKRREGEIFDRVKSSAKTGLTMTFTTISALFVAYLIATSFVLKQMFLIILIGLFVDIISTYFMNASILRWYTEKKYGK